MIELIKTIWNLKTTIEVPKIHISGGLIIQLAFLWLLIQYPWVKTVKVFVDGGFKALVGMWLGF